GGAGPPRSRPAPPPPSPAVPPHFRGQRVVMGQNLHTLLTVAAELRSGGASWEAVAAKVSRRPATCRRWPARFRADWEPLYREAQGRRYEEAGNEALALLRRHMRAAEAKTSLRAVELMLRYGLLAAPA